VPVARPAGAPGPAAAPPARRVKECPFCRKEIPEVALECPACRRRIAGAGRPEDFQRRLLAQELVLRQALRDGKLAEKPRGLLAVLRLPTLVAGAGILAALAGAAVVSGVLGRSDLVALAAPFGLVLPVFFVGFLVSDLMWLSVSRRRDPVSALKAFLRAMKIDRYREAYACVLPGDHDGRVRGRRAVREVGIGPVRSTFQDVAGFRAYWEPVFKAPDTHLSFSRPQVSVEQGDFAMVSVEIALSQHGPGTGGGLIGAALRRLTDGIATLTLRKLVRRVDRRWYLVNGELDSPEDGAMAEFAALAAAPDEQLVQLSRAPAAAATTEA
jgi:hypothetical protein